MTFVWMKLKSHKWDPKKWWNWEKIHVLQISTFLAGSIFCGELMFIRTKHFAKVENRSPTEITEKTLTNYRFWCSFWQSQRKNVNISVTTIVRFSVIIVAVTQANDIWYYEGVFSWCNATGIELFERSKFLWTREICTHDWEPLKRDRFHELMLLDTQKSCKTFRKSFEFLKLWSNQTTENNTVIASFE